MTDKGLAARIHCHCQARGTSEDNNNNNNNNNLYLYSLLLKKEKRLFSNILRSFQASKCDDCQMSLFPAAHRRPIACFLEQSFSACYIRLQATGRFQWSQLVAVSCLCDYINTV